MTVREIFVCAVLALAACGHAAVSSAQEAGQPRKGNAGAAEARALLDKAKKKLQAAQTLTVEFDTTASPGQAFTREGEMFLERPNRYRVEKIGGVMVPQRELRYLSNGQTVTKVNEQNFIAYEQPVRRENFFLGVN